MKVMFLLNELRLGGAERATLRHVDALIRHGHTVACISAPGILLPSLPLGTIFFSIPNFSYMQAIKICFLLRRAIVEFAPDVIHSQSASLVLLARISLLFPQKKNGSSIRLVLQFHKTRLGRLPERLSALLLDRACDAIIALTKTQYDYFRRLGISRARLTIIPNFIMMDDFFNARRSYNAPKIKDELGIPKQGVILCSVGRLIPGKGVEEFLTVLNMLGSSDKDYYGLIIGDGASALSLKKMSRDIGVDNRIRFIGYTDTVEKYLAITDILLSLSKEEVLPLALIEALAARIPIVCSDIAQHREIVQNGINGYCVPCDPKIIVQIITTRVSRLCLQNNPVCDALRHHFDEHVVLPKILDLYRS